MDRKKLFVVIAAAGFMVIAAFGFYANSFLTMEQQSRIYEESPEMFVYADSDRYEMGPGETIQIPILLDINHKNKEVTAQVSVFGIAQDRNNERFVKTGQDTLPTGFSGYLDKDTIYLPATLPIDSNVDADRPDINYIGETKQERLMLILTSDDSISPGRYDFAPTVFTNAIDGSNVRISSSFVVQIPSL